MSYQIKLWLQKMSRKIWWAYQNGQFESITRIMQEWFHISYNISTSFILSETFFYKILNMFVDEMMTLMTKNPLFLPINQY